jgi:CheY-like chemotaxis protein
VNLASCGHGLRVLIVEDHATAATALAPLLRQDGHQVQVAPDSQAALKAAENAALDVVLLDIGLPGLDGYQLARRISAFPHGKRPLVIALFEADQNPDYLPAPEGGIDLHLLKPPDPGRVQRLLRRFQRVVA